MRKSPPSEDGSVTPLVIGFAVVLALLVAVVVDASAAYLEREGLSSLADGAALAATDGVQGEIAYVHGLDDQVAVDPSAARRYVAAYLRATDAAARFEDLRWSVTVEARTVAVTVRARLRLPLHVPGGPSSTVVAGTSAAVVTIGR